MHIRTLAAAAALIGASAACAAQAADDPELKALQSEIKALKQDYETRIQALEDRLKKAEAKAAQASAPKPAPSPAPVVMNAAGKPMAVPPLTAPPQAQPNFATAQEQPSTASQVVLPELKSSAPAPGEMPPPQAGVQTYQVQVPEVQVPQVQMPSTSAPRTVAAGNAFNPNISAVLNGFVFSSSHDPALQTISGFVMPDEAGLESRGFSIGESEFAMFANIDPYVRGWLDVSFDNESQASVEEAYIQTLHLGGGFNAKAGRFLSAIGYLNEGHAHDWQFSDAPLPYRVFLGNQYGDDGVQLRWLVPTALYLEAGAEWFRGASFPAAGESNGGKGTYTGFVRLGSDLGPSASWFGALSYMHARADNRVDGADTFTGKDDIGIASVVFKYAPYGNIARHKLTLTGEYFYDATKGEFDLVPIDLQRSGWYAQAAFQFRPRWTIGARYAALKGDGVPLALAGSTLDDLGHDPRAITGLLEFDTSEFGRFRLQYTHDQSSPQTNDEVLLQYTVIYGPHPAHRY